MNAPQVSCGALLLTALLAIGCQHEPARGEIGAGGPRTVTVDTITPQRVEIERTSTQPATVHADMQAHIHAKVAGYVEKLNVDIGQSVVAGEVMVTLSVPEMAKQRDAQLATITRLEAEERRAAAQRDVAASSVDAYAAMVEQATAEIAKAEANLTASRVEQERIQKLVDQRAIASSLLDEANRKYDAAEAERGAATAGVTSAEAQLALAKSQLAAAEADVQVAQSMTTVAKRELDELDELIKYAELRAPFDGVVTARNIDVGELVRNAQNGQGSKPLLVVSQIDTLRVRVPLPERDAPLANVGDTAKLRFQAFPGEEFSGEISRISNALDPQTRTMIVEIDVAHPETKLLPGMFGQAKVHLEESADQILLPANVVRYDEQGESTVYVVDASNQVQIVPVKTGWDNGENIQITSGLSGDEQVIGPSLHRFQSGQTVQVR